MGRKSYVPCSLGSLMVQGRDPGESGHHYAGKKLHGSNVAGSKGVRSAGEDLEHSQRLAKMAQWGRQDGPHSQPLAGGQIDARVVLRVMAQHDLARTDAIGGNTGIGLKTSSQVGCGTAGACTADDLVPFAQSDRRAGGTGQRLRALG